MAEEQIATQLVQMLRLEQRDHWQNGKRIPIEAYLQQRPVLEENGQRALELVYHEVLLREELPEWAYPNTALVVTFVSEAAFLGLLFWRTRSRTLL